MHGCTSSDVWWLAKDCGICTWSVFDTQEFAKYLDGKKTVLALSALWVKNCEGLYDIDILAKKEMFQKSDWAERPLTDQMKRYAAHDSFFLIHIAQR